MERRSTARRFFAAVLTNVSGLPEQRQTTTNTEVPKMKTLIAGAALVSAGSAQAADKVKVGLLTCDVQAGVGYIIGSDKGLDCWFKPSSGGKTEHYHGSVKKLGIDLGFTVGGKLGWLVFALQGHDWHHHALAGTYVGASAEASVGVGLGANWLVGGSGKSFALQPWSVQGNAGLNYSIAWTNLTLN
jgi:hypothetical protein